MPNHQSHVVAVITTFNPGSELVDNVEQLQKQVSQVIVVDDGSEKKASSVLRLVEERGVTVVRLSENFGIGKAINDGVEAARSFSPEFILTFDQDSSIQPGFVGALVDEYDRLHKQDLRVGMVAPNYYGLTSQAEISQDLQYLEAQSPIQSGLLMPLSVIDQLGPQREGFFIDLIDTEYFFRAKQAGFLAACVPGLVLKHGFGHRLYVHAFGKRLTKADGRARMVAVSTPFRYYYRARNRILLNRQFKGIRSFKKTLRRQALNDLVLDFGVAIYSARGKWSLIRVIFAGWLDGLRNRSGKIPSKIMSRARNVSWRHLVETDSD